MVGGDTRLQRGEDEGLPIAGDLEDGAAAVAHVEVLAGVESYAGGHAHAFGVNGGRSLRRDTMHGSLVPRGNIQVAVGVQGQGGCIDETGEQHMHLAVWVDLENGNRGLLAARTREGDEDLALVIDGGAGDRVDVLGQQPGDVHLDLVAAGAVAEYLQPGRRGGDLRNAHDEPVVPAEQDRGRCASDLR